MKSLLIALASTITLTSTAWAQTASAPSHLRLLDRLDRPQDGYCLDIPGVGRNLVLDVPVFAHNCKGGLTTDSAVIFEADGRIRFPSVDLCVTAAGVNGTVLPGTSIMLRDCGVTARFVGSDRLQQFELAGDGSLTLAGTDLCLSVGDRSERTFSAADRWRALFVEACAVIEPARARWEFIVP